MAEETILLNVEIDQSDAQKQLVQTEKNLLNLKKQQADLTKEYKAGKISQDQYVESNLRLQKAIQKENDQKRTLTRLIDTESNSRNALKNRVSSLTKEYDNLNRSTAAGAKRAAELEKELSELNAEINKSSKSAGLFKDQIGNYPAAFADATNQIQPFGASVSGATESIAKFANPATAALGILTGLAAAYLKSSAGAKDLAFAQDRLTFVTSSLIESLGTLVSGTGEGGQGLLNKLLDTAIATGLAMTGLGLVFGDTVNDINEQSKAAARAGEELRKLGIEAIRAQGFAKLFEKTAEEARRLRDDEENDLQDRLRATDTIVQNLTANQKVRVNIIEQEIEALKKANVNWQNNDNVVREIESRQANILDIQEEITGKLTENVSARQAILKLIEEERNLEAGNARALQRQNLPQGRNEALDNPFLDNQLTQELAFANAKIQLGIQERLNDDLLKANQQFYEQDVKNKQAAVNAKINSDFLAAQVTADVLGTSAALFEQNTEQYKVLATAQTLIDTYVGAQRAFNALAGIVPAGPALGAAAAAAAVIAGLGRVAAINNVQFAEGGYTGPGSKYQPAGIVHAGEYVAPQSVMAMPAAQPHIAALEGMRTGKRSFADGGFVAQQAIAPYQLALITANAIKNMPQPVVSWTEGRATGRRVEWREQISKR